MLTLIAFALKLLEKQKTEFDHYRNSAVKILGKIANVIPKKQLIIIKDPLLKALKDRNFQVQESAAESLFEILKRISNKQIPAIIWALGVCANNNEEVYRSLSQISLQKFLNYSTSQYWKEILPFFIEQVIERKSPLYVQQIENKPYLCFIENNQVIQQAITSEQMQYLKKMEFGKVSFSY